MLRARVKRLAHDRWRRGASSASARFEKGNGAAGIACASKSRRGMALRLVADR